MQLPGGDGARHLPYDGHRGRRPIKGTYVGRVELAEPDPPRSFVLRARGQGAPGTVDATVRVRLSNGDGGTRIDYDADAVVGGMVGGVGQRMLGSVAKRTAGEFFAAVERDLTAPAPVVSPAPPAAPPGPAQAGPVYLGRAPAVPDRTAPPETNAAWPMAAAFVSGGAVALAGVAVGYLLGRRGDEPRGSAHPTRSTTKISVSPGLIAGLGLRSP